MTDQNHSTEENPAAGQGTAVNPEPLAPDASNGPGEGEHASDENTSSEAARWRRKLRDTEAALEQLTERLSTLQRGEVERLAGEHMSAPADMWAIGIELGGLLSEDGRVDGKKVADTVQGILAERPTWSKHQRSPIAGKPRERLMGGADPTHDEPPTNWSGILGGKRR